MTSTNNLDFDNSYSKHNDYIDEFTQTQILDLFVKYLNEKLNLKDKPRAIVRYNRDFSFEIQDKETLETICVATLDDLLESCNNVESDDDLFENKDDLINAIKENLGENALNKIAIELEDKYKVICI